MGGLRIACCGFHYRRELDSAAVVYMRALTTTHPILCIKANQREWLNNYLATKQQLTSYDSLLRLLQRFCDHHSFSRQRPTKNKVKQADLAEVQSHFTAEFHREYIAYARSVCSTLMKLAYSMICATFGQYEAEAPKSCHSLRMTAVLMVRADSTKLLILFIMKGVPGVRIDSGELSMFPPGHQLRGSGACMETGQARMGHAPFKRNRRKLWLLEDIIVGDDDDSFSLTSRQKHMALVKRSIAAWDLVLRRSFEKALPH
ncbi:hypothetical protein DYB36_009997 [Aphanomyces astaci]|uniref:Core-binding (CB) domain-containing protein n=1 Tax=Aphanomyces astaci TaxID=112090 RepID=A0A397BG73_APHAT|nr:hypothetical protein DYB36_009997 [Aphanomyces astaci]